jgi:hypothetical protein
VGWMRLLPVIIVFPLFLSLPCPAADSKPVLPDGKAVWNHLKSTDFRKSFSLWPGTQEQGPGKGQHGSISSTWVNRPALDGINGQLGTMPVGSILVKESFDDGKALQNITVMYKARSYNPSAGNWFWVKYSPDGEIQLEGRVSPCIGCHEEKKDNDFVQTGLLK